MFTVKIRWFRLEDDDDGPSKLADETTWFISADRVAVHGEVTSLDTMKAWKDDEYLNYTIVNHKTEKILPSRLIEVVKDEKSTYYLASQAWIMGPDGSTIERVAP